MYKIFLASLLTISSIAWSQYLYAHNENPERENTETRHDAENAKEKQQDRENWDDFMKAVKEQETKSNTDKEHSNPSSQ